MNFMKQESKMKPTNSFWEFNNKPLIQNQSQLKNCMELLNKLLKLGMMDWHLKF